MSWTEDHRPFVRAVGAALARRQLGQPPVPLVRGDRSPRSRRGFGVELEFDIEPASRRERALAGIGNELHSLGLVRRPAQRQYHSAGSDGRSWRFERDSTVHAEVVSPVLHDEPRAWAEVSAVCRVVRSHGGAATDRTGGHVHVSVGDFAYSLESHARLLALFRAYEDTLYRLSQNPARVSHRGTRSCAPNRPLSAGDRTPVGLALHHSGHHLALNFAHATGRRADDHVEFRQWDATLDPGVVQTQVRLSLALADAAVRAEVCPPADSEPLGTHAARGDDRPEYDCLSFRRLVDCLFRDDADKEQAAALFAVTRWQRAGV